MKISSINQKITIQNSVSTCDTVGNQILLWEDYHTCFAEVCEKSGNEKISGDVIATETISFYIRYCKQLDNISNSSFRIVFRQKTYNIRYIDFMNYNGKYIKIKCTLEDD